MGVFRLDVDLFMHGYISQFPKISVWAFSKLWLLNLIRYFLLPILICGILPPIALLTYSGKQNALIRNFTIAFWVISALIISWFASWRNLSYWQPDIFERYFGLALPIIAGIGLVCLFQQSRFSKKRILIISIILLPLFFLLIPILCNRTDGNGPGTLFFYVISNYIGIFFTIIIGIIFVAIGIWMLKFKNKIKIISTLLFTIILLSTSAFRLSKYSQNMHNSGLPYYSMVSKNCDSNEPLILLTVGIANSWHYSRLRSTMPWIEYDISGINNKEIVLHLYGNALAAGNKWCIAPLWYDLPFDKIDSTNGFNLYYVNQNNFNNKKILVDKLSGNQNNFLSLTNNYTFMLPGETALTARIGIEFRTDNIIKNKKATIIIKDNYDTKKTKVRNIIGQSGKNTVALFVKRPDCLKPFYVNIIINTNWPILRAWTDFPLCREHKIE